MKDWRQETYESELFAKSVVAEHVGMDESAIQHVSADNLQSPFDFQIHGLKFDVKFSSPTHCDSTDKTFVWDFDIRYKTNYCDYLILIGMEDNAPRAVFAVPFEISPHRHLRVSVHGFSKWHKYQIWGKKFKQPEPKVVIPKPKVCPCCNRPL